MNSGIGLVVALKAEAVALIGRGPWQRGGGCLFRNSRRIRDIPLWVARSGMGMTNAGCAAEWLIRKGVSALGVSGVSGGLSPDLAPGDLIVADAVLQKENQQYKSVWKEDRRFADRALSGVLSKGLSASCGPIVTVQKPVLSAPDKETLFKQSRALGVDMESAAVAAAARRADIPFFAIRSVCDSATASIPGDIFEWLDSSGRVRLPCLLRRLLLRPALIRDLWTLKGDFGTALNGLRQTRDRFYSLIDSERKMYGS